MIIPVILAGGSGSRLWPLSRESYPKQFLPLFDGMSLFQKTIIRCEGLPDVGSPMVIVNEQHRFLVKDALVGSQKTASIVFEPTPKSTAPAVGFAALEAVGLDADAILLVLPSDHVIEDSEGFQKTVKAGTTLAEEGALVTFGITPTMPHTGYGYIRVSDQFKVESFVEKPNLETAKAFLETGQYYWNSGMFLFKASAYLQALEVHAPFMLESLKAAYSKRKIEDYGCTPEIGAWNSIIGDSIDCAVMEKSTNVACIPLCSNWNDVGSWSALGEALPKDQQGNTFFGDVETIDTKNCFLYAQKRLLTTVGVENLVVVETPDVILVADKSQSEHIKPLVQFLKQQGRPEVDSHQKVHRPWGHYESIDQGVGFQVKRITVKVGGRLSLQMHHHRSEHWVVVRGHARVTRDTEVFTLSANESTYIPLGVKHRLENVGTTPLEIIEVQSGSYLGEDDIVRFDDHYGRLSVKKPSEIES